jgi:hypothetical protein
MLERAQTLDHSACRRFLPGQHRNGELRCAHERLSLGGERKGFGPRLSRRFDGRRSGTRVSRGDPCQCPVSAHRFEQTPSHGSTRTVRASGSRERIFRRPERGATVSLGTACFSWTSCVRQSCRQHQ